MFFSQATSSFWTNKETYLVYAEIAASEDRFNTVKDLVKKDPMQQGTEFRDFVEKEIIAVDEFHFPSHLAQSLFVTALERINWTELALYLQIDSRPQWMTKS